MTEQILPQQKTPKLIVVVGFDRGEDGELFAAFGPAEQQTEQRAITLARALVQKHSGFIAWSRDANPTLGEYARPPS